MISPKAASNSVKNNPVPLILASASPRRVALLAQIGMTPAAILPAQIDESPRPGELPAPYAVRIAREKCAVIAHPESRILAADTVVALGRRILPKADDAATARRCLQLLSGRRHQVLTAVCLRDAQGAYRETLVRTVVKFARLSPADIDAYLASGEWEGKAGGYAIQGTAASFVAFIAGSYSNVVGLPLHETAKLLRH